MKYEQINLELLIPYVNNAKKHSPEQIKKVASSIKEFGFIAPIIIDKDNGLISGHCRLEASKLLQLKTVPVLRVEHLTEAQKKAYIIADNRLAEVHTSWDMELLKIELDGLKELDFDLQPLGFDFDIEEDKKDDKHDDEESIYSEKIEAPIYTPKLEKKPNINELFDKEKYTQLIDEINKSNLPNEEKEFLILAATRHIVFNFKNIAEYYSHSEKETQELFENNALVIIDFQKAIENGFITMTKELQNEE